VNGFITQLIFVVSIMTAMEIVMNKQLTIEAINTQKVIESFQAFKSMIEVEKNEQTRLD
jgi:hypothetical protein